MKQPSSVTRFSPILLTLAAGLFMLSVTACSKTNTEKISVSGSTTVLPVISLAADQYHTENPQIRVLVNAGGSGTGIKQLGDSQTDIGMISRDISDTELQRYPDAGFKTHAIGIDAVVPVVSSEIYNTGVTALTREQIAAIYVGDITNWQEVGGPDQDILVIDKEASRGTRHVFMSYVLGDKNAQAPGAKMVLGSNNEEQTALVQSDAAIGMLSHAWLNDDVRGLAIVTNNGDTIKPTLDNIRNGTFPITRDLLLVTRKDISEPAQAFIDYIKSPEGQSFVEAAGYVKIAGK